MIWSMNGCNVTYTPDILDVIPIAAGLSGRCHVFSALAAERSEESSVACLLSLANCND